MKGKEVIQGWGKILAGRRPFLSIEITRECPLRCPGCYAYGDTHIGNAGVTLRQLADFKGDELVRRVLAIVDDLKPLHLSIVGGDPLVRYRELDQILPALMARGIHVQVVTSAFRVIPLEWAKLPLLNVTVSVDGLPAEHDVRRKPATYERILANLAGHTKMFSIHCTVTSQLVRPGYLRKFIEFWEPRPEVKRIWFSLYTPQIGEISEERLSWEQRQQVTEELLALRSEFKKLDMIAGAINGFMKPPSSPGQCTFARSTETISADLKARITPCQFGGNPNCSECGCVASVGLHALADYRLGGLVRLGSIFNASLRIGEAVDRRRQRMTSDLRVPRFYPAK
ncbi:MAG TPA: radical SAM protein [Terriglobales bacterium]|nr:radical SAM protein [Terriglobales bacterium]